MAEEHEAAPAEPAPVSLTSTNTEPEAPARRAISGRDRRQRIAALKQELVDGELLTAAEVAEILDIHPRTVGEYIRDGRLRAFQFGGSWRISENALRAFVREQPRRCSFCGKVQVRRRTGRPERGLHLRRLCRPLQRDPGEGGVPFGR